MGASIETKRLRLRPFTTGDAKFIVELLNTPGWLAYIGDRNVKTEAQAVLYLENGPIASYRANGFGLNAVDLKQSGLTIGMCGIIRRDALDHPDIGFAFLPEFMGRGYAFEAANATLQFAVDHLKLPVVAAITVPNNQASIRLLEKIGMKLKGTTRLAADDEALLLFTNETPVYLK